MKSASPAVIAGVERPFLAVAPIVFTWREISLPTQPKSLAVGVAAVAGGITAVAVAAAIF